MHVRPARRLAFISLLVAAIVALSLGVGVALHRLDVRDRPRQAQRLARSLGIHPGSWVAEIGAGSGAMTVEMARIVGPTGRVIATEVTSRQRDVIRAAARDGGVTNVSVAPAGDRDSNLPAGCCDAVYMQRVYHHLTNPAPVIASIGRALKPGGRIAVLEFEPGWIANFSTPPGVPNRGGHGVPKQMLLREMRNYGLEPVGQIEEFGNELYLAVFRRPLPR